jgi:hypothetical protein
VLPTKKLDTFTPTPVSQATLAGSCRLGESFRRSGAPVQNYELYCSDSIPESRYRDAVASSAISFGG